MSLFKRITVFVLIACVVISATSGVFADDNYPETTDWWTWFLNSQYIDEDGNVAIDLLEGCEDSISGLHSIHSVSGVNTCKYCGVPAKELLYNYYIDSLTVGQDTGDDSADYGLRLYYFDGVGTYYYHYYGYEGTVYSSTSDALSISFDADSQTAFPTLTFSGASGYAYFDITTCLDKISPPFNGYYTTTYYGKANGIYLYSSGELAGYSRRSGLTAIGYLGSNAITLFNLYDVGSSSYSIARLYKTVGSGSPASFNQGVRAFIPSGVYGSMTYWITVKVELAAGETVTVPNIVNITGDIYVINDDGTYTVINNNTFIDTENNIFYNPTTNEYYNYTDYSINFEEFTIYLTLDTGDTVTINYGDEYITINQNVTYIDNSTGDTITNNYTYNYYYYGDGTGSDDDGDDDSTSFWQWLKDRFFNALGALIDKIFEWILDLLDFLIDGLFSMLKGLWGIVNDVLFGFGDLVGEFFGAFKEGGGLFDFDGVTYDYEPLTTDG